MSKNPGKRDKTLTTPPTLVCPPSTTPARTLIIIIILIIIITITSSACSSVDFPWKPPPQMSEMPAGMTMPLTGPQFGSVTSRSSDGGDTKGTASEDDMGSSRSPPAEARTTNTALRGGEGMTKVDGWESSFGGGHSSGILA
jgi:hypothetical protein